VNGILVQLPLPGHLDEQAIIERIAQHKVTLSNMASEDKSPESALPSSSTQLETSLPTFFPGRRWPSPAQRGSACEHKDPRPWTRCMVIRQHWIPRFLHPTGDDAAYSSSCCSPYTDLKYASSAFQDAMRPQSAC
jgi:hypothetical protein